MFQIPSKNSGKGCWLLQTPLNLICSSMQHWLKAQGFFFLCSPFSLFGISPHVFSMPWIQSHPLELQLNVILWMKAHHRLRTNVSKQLTDPFMDSHPVGLLVALITAEDKTTFLITLLTPLVHLSLFGWTLSRNLLGNACRGFPVRQEISLDSLLHKTDIKQTLKK